MQWVWNNKTVIKLDLIKSILEVLWVSYNPQESHGYFPRIEVAFFMSQMWYSCLHYKENIDRDQNGFFSSILYLGFYVYTVVFSGMYLKLWCKNTSMLTLHGNRLDLFLVTILFAKEKIRSDGTDVAGMCIYFLNNKNKWGNSFLCSFHHCRTSKLMLSARFSGTGFFR